MARKGLKVIGCVVAIIGVIIAVPLLVFVVPIYLLSSGVSREVVQTVPSLDQKFKAVVVAVDGGATTSVGSVIYIERYAATRNRNEVAMIYGAINDKETYGVDLAWTGSRQLTIRYREARFKRVPSRKVSSFGEEFKLVLVEGGVTQ